MSLSTKLGHGAAKILGIKLDERTGPIDPTTRGESVFSVTSADTYVEEEPRVADWLAEATPSAGDVVVYMKSLFPFTHWIWRYNLQWLAGDVIAGVTIGAVVVPQGMAYASLADLDPQFGLYSAFMGVLIYWIFGTSKDISIGPVAVMSTITGTIVTAANAANPTYALNVYASALAVMAGSIITFIGLIRIGWIVEFISLAAISAFITGSAFSIAMGQIPNLLGISSSYVNSHSQTYHVVIGVLQNLDHVSLDAALGLTALLFLYLIRFTLQTLAKKYPTHARAFFFANTLRTVFVILLYTLISWASERHIDDASSKGHWKLVGTVPRGFQNAGVPVINKEIISSFASQLPAAVIVLLIEHISIAKSFGRINNYTINPSQELMAIGITNLLGPFVGAYPATGSFSRTAINSKSGVRTPLGGLFAAIVVLLAIYALPAVFYWIPTASLAAVIIHAVLDLITPANTVYHFWKISPLEVPIFLAGVIITVFASIEDGIYTTICTSLALLLYRLVKARGRFLGRVKVHSVIGDHLLENEEKEAKPREFKKVGKNGEHDLTVRNVFLPLDRNDGSNPQVELENPYPGIFIYRFSEGFNYPNASHYLEHMVSTIFAKTRRTATSSFGQPGDRPWNAPGPKKGREEDEIHSSLPTLKAVILDFSSVNNVDLTSVQNMIDVRNQLDRYAAPDYVEWHIACINNRWTKRALVAAGFGLPVPVPGDAAEFHAWKPVFSVAEIGGAYSAAATAEATESSRRRTLDIEAAAEKHDDAADVVAGTAVGTADAAGAGAGLGRVTVVHGLNRPLFHIDLTSALHSAIQSVEAKAEYRREAAGTTKREVVVAEEPRRGSGSGSGSGSM